MTNPFIGTILYFGFDWAPDGWVKCNGDVVNIRGKESLFSLLQTTFGGNGTTTFGLPNLKDRSIVGQSDSIPFAQPGGNIQSTVQTANLPAHSHASAGDITLMACTDGAQTNDPTNAYFSGSDVRGTNYGKTPTVGQFSGPAVAIVAPYGPSTGVNTMSPSLALNPCIAYAGIFPPRS